MNTVGGSHSGPGGFAALDDAKCQADAQCQAEVETNLLAAVRLDRGLIPATIEAAGSWSAGADRQPSSGSRPALPR